MASNPFDEFDAPATPGAAPAAAPAPAPQTNAFDEFDNAKPAGMMRRVLGDGGIALAKGIIGVPEAAVGLADLATGGRVGKALENEGGAVGFRPKQAKEYLDTFKSGEQQLADARVAAAGQDGDLLDYGKALIQNPSTLVSAGVESAPSFIGGAAVARGFMKGAQLAGRAMSPVVAGAVGEGAVAAGQNAEQVRQETETGLLTPGQSGVLAASGAVTGALGFGSGKLAQRLGIGDIETMLAQGKFGPVPKVPKTEAERILAEKAASKGLLRKVGEGFVTEGILQETPQSAQEQAAQNIALGKPLMEGVGQAAIQGGLVGGFMGAGGAGLSDIMEGRRPPAAAPAPLPGPFSAAVETLALPAPGMGGAGRPIAVGPDGEASTGAQRDSVESQRLQAGLANPRPRSTDGLVETGAAIGQGYPVIDAPARTVADNPAAPVATPAQTVGNTPREIAYNQASDEDRSLYDSIFGAPDVQDVQAKAPNMLDAALARDVNWEIDPESETPEADFLAAMGFTEEEQQDAIEEANRQLREEAQSAAAAPARDGSGDAEAAANGPAAARAPAGDQEGRAAVGAGQAQAVAAPTLDTTGWTVKKLGERSMEELNDLWQQVRAAHSRPVVGDGPVDETGLATSEPLTEEGQRLRTMLERAQKIAYDRRKAERAKEQANGSDVLATDQPPADAGAAAGAGGAGAAEARAAGVPGAVAEQGAGAGAGGDEPRAGRAARAGGGNGAAERPVAEPVGRAAEQPGGGAVVVDAGGQPDGPDGANRLGGRGRAGGAATANTGAGAGGAELTYTGPTMAEINAISDVKTVDVIREAQDMVGEDELRRRAQQKIDDYSKGGKFKVSEPMMIEATAREVVALGRRAQAAAKATRDNQPVLEQDRNGLAERRAPLEGKERWPAPLAMKGAPKELAPAQQAVVAYMNGDISRTEMLQALANSGLPYGTMGGITQRLGNDGPSIGELEHLSQGRMPPAPETQDIDAAAHEAATSPTNDLPEPTDAQKEAGNYKKGHINVQGLDISVENPKGSTRSGTREDGSTWSHEMSDHYGYVKRTTGADGEQIDVYVGPEPDAGTVYVVDQIDQGTGRFDEHKAMIGYPSREAAREAYASNFDKDWKVGRITAMSMDEFKEFISDPKRSQFPASGINDGPNGPKPQTPYQKAKQKAELRNLRDNRNQRPEPAPVEEIDTLLEGLPVAQLNAMAADLGAPIGANRAMTEASIEAKESDLGKLQALAAKHADASTEPRIVTAEQVVNDKERAPDVKTDECLVLMACGSMKLDHRARADELYTGPFWTTYRTHEPKGTKPQMVVLSAKHGFVPRDQMLSPYDQEMTAERQGELMGQLGVQVDNIQKALKGRKVKDVLIVGGKNYRDLMASAVLELQKRGSISQDASINRTEGEIGEQRSDLGKYLNGLPSAASAAAPAPAPTTAPATAKPKRENKLQRELREAEEARSAYFTPGNVVRSYGGFDRVIAYHPPTTPGGQWSVDVRAVNKTGPATFEDTPNERVRTHSTQPRPSELKTGPAGKMKAPTRQELKAELDALQAEANGRAPVEYLNEQQLERRRQILDQMDKAPEAPAPETTPEPEPAEATHADPGEAAEPATAPVVAESLQKAARAEDRTPAQMKADLLAQVDEAMKTASTDPDALRQMQLATYTVGKPSRDDVLAFWKDHPKLSYEQASEALTKQRQKAQDARSAEAAEQVGYVTFDVPGDGKFKVVNHVEKLAEFRKKVQASPGFKAPAPRADNTPKAPASAGTVAAIQNMVEEGDFQAALDYATAKGVDLGDIKMTKAERANLDAWLKTNPTPTGEEADAAPAPAAAAAPAAPNALELTPKQFHEATLRAMAADTGATLAEVRENYDTEAGRAENDKAWVDAVRQAFKAGTPLTRETLDKLEEVRPGAVASFVHDYPDAKVPNGYQTPTARATERQAADEKKQDRAEAKASRAAAAPTPKAEIADAGEKIGGARKDRWKDRGMNVSDLDAMSETEGAELATKANVWKPDWAKLVEDGMNPALAAHAKIIYDRLAAQPKDNTPAGRRRFVQMMQAVRQVYGSLTPENVATARQRLLYEQLKWTEGRDSTTNELARKNAQGVEDLAAHMRDQRQTLFSVYKGRSDPFSFDSMDMRKVRKMIEEGFPAKGEAWKKRFSTRERPIKGITPRGRELLTADAEKLGTPIDFAKLESDGGTYWEVRQNANNRVVGYATSQAQADELARAAYAKALADGKSTLVQPERPHLDVLERTGLPQRLDRDATPDDFIKDFGFRGVEFGNWSAQDERQRIINMAYDGLMDLAQIMGVPPQAMSLNGKLGMAFGARGGGKFAAHYEPGRLVINMTKIRGGGSMAHEWAHALDHYFGELDRADAYMGKARGASGWTTQENYNGLPRDRMEKDAQGNWVNVKRTRLENLRPEVARAFDRVMSSLFSVQVGKAEHVRALELRLEREQARAAAMTDPQMKKVYEDGVARTEAELARVRAMDDSATFEGGRSSYSTEASKLDKGKANGYWSQPTELFARAFESWVQDRIQGMGAKSDYLVHGVEGNRFTGEQYAGNPYPSGKERDAINAAFDNLAKTIKTRDGNDGRATMFSIDDQTDTPAFKAWFGDSKVVDEQGKPLVVYHGTNADFTAFSGRPVWFHADPSQAFASGDGANVMPAYVRIENPIRRSGYFGMEDFTNPARFKFFDKTTGKWVTPDGVIGDNGIVVAFRPEQIKSATGNNGAFDPTNPNITMDLEGLPTIDQNFAVPEDVLPPRYQAASPTRQAKVERLQANLRKQYGPGVTIQAVEPGQMSELEAQAMAGVRSTASRLFGHDVVFVRFPPGSTPLFNGVVSQDQNGTIFVNMDARRPHMAVVGHELLHQLRTNNAPLYQQLQQRMAAIYKSGAEGQYFDRIRSAYAMHGLPVPKEWQEEMLADVVGDHFMDPQFWSDIGAGMKPGPFKMLVQAILRFIDRLRGLMTGARPFGTEQYLNDLEAARAAVVQAMGQFSAQQMANPGQRTNVQARVADQEEGPLDRGTMLSIATDPQALQQAARESFATLMNTPGKLNWWHKTVGSPYNLAQKSPAFKRVYDNVQDFLKDVSGYATEAADLAPNLLPKLESIKDVAKKPISAEDSKAIAAPIFEGTLTWARDPSTGKAVKAKELEDRFAQHTTEQKAQMMLRKDLVSEGELKSWQALPPASYQGAVNNRFEQTVLRPGVVWSDAELKSQFGLNDRQVAQYREFRAAIDKSLESLGLSDIVRFAGKDGKAVAQMVMDSGDVRTGSELMRDHLLAMAEADPRRNTELIDTANRVVEKADRIKQLQREGYAPLSRFGKYTVDVVDKDGERAYFGLFESRFEAAKMANQMQKNYPDATVTQGTMSKEAHQLFAGVSPETLELFGDMLGLEAQGSGPQHEAFQQYLKLAKSNRSAMKRLIERKGIAGFSEDPARVLAGFIYSNARQTSSAIHQGDILESVNDIPQQQGELKDAAVKLANYVNNPVEEAAGFRGLLFTQYIGGSIASAMVNLTQPLQTTMPYLSQFGGIRQAAKNTRSAARDALRPDEALKDSEPDLYRALKRAEEEGTVSPQEVHQLMAQARGAATLKSGDGTTVGNAWAGAQNRFEQLTFAWGKLFSTAEQYNRRTTFIASYRTAKDNGMSPSEAFKFAEKAINETQFVANKGNRPRWARGAIGSTLFTFKSYSVNYVEMLARMATAGEPGSPERAAGQRAALLALGVLFLMGGAGGLPFADDIGDLIDAVMQRLGYNFNTKQKRQELLQDIFGEAGGKFVDKGVSGLSGFPLDVSGRMGMGNLIPGTGLLTKKEDYSRDALEVFGAAGDFGKRVAQSAEAVSGGQFGKAAQTIAPKAAGNLIQGIDMANTGMYRDQKGRKVIDTTAAEAAMKMIGFQPTSVARVQEATGDQYNAIAQNRIQSQAISDLWAEGMATRDPAKVQEAQQMLRDWNAKNPDTPIRPNLKAIQAKAKTMMQDKVTRLEKTAPKAMRAEVRRELQNDLR